MITMIIATIVQVAALAYIIVIVLKARKGTGKQVDKTLTEEEQLLKDVDAVTRQVEEVIYWRDKKEALKNG